MNGPTTMLISASEAKAIVEAGIAEGKENFSRSLEVILERTLAFMERNPDRFIWPPDSSQSRSVTYECFFAMLGAVFCTWAFWILESKGIVHHGVPDTGWREFMEKTLAPTLDVLFRDARNLAREEKQQSLDRQEVPSNTVIPAPYNDWRTAIS